MDKKPEACLICGAPLIYLMRTCGRTCAVCGGTFPSNACCERGHFVCDGCHMQRALEEAMSVCLDESSLDPIAILKTLMGDPCVHMHGPEHHALVGAALLTAYRNSGGSLDLAAALREMAARAGRIPGGSCGLWGCCGAAVSAGVFLSIVTQTTPLSRESWGLCNRMSARALAAVGEIGGPRCCKRTSFLAAAEAAGFVREHLGIEMRLPEPIVCTFSAQNRQCLGRACPFSPLAAHAISS